MSQTSFDFLNMLVRPPGDVLYFLAVIAIALASLFMALGQRLRQPQDRGAQRYTLAALGTVVSWILLVVGALYTLLSEQDSNVILPPLERAISIVTVLLLGWAFLAVDHPRWKPVSNIALLLLLAVAIVAYVLTSVKWAELAGTTDFSQSTYGLLWIAALAVLAFSGIILTALYFRLVVDAPLKLVFFTLLLLGCGVALYQIAREDLVGDYAGPARLGLLGALPVLPAIIYRMIVHALVTDESPQPMSPLGQAKSVRKEMLSIPPQAPGGAVSPTQRESVQLLRALGIILDNATPTNIPDRVVLAAVDTLKADIGAILKLQDANYVDVLSGYDKVMDRSISGVALNLDDQPTLVNAIERQAQRPLYLDRNIDELQDFYTRLDISQAGPVYFQPLVHEDQLVAVLAVGLPYSGRELLDSEAELLKGIAVIAAALLSLSFSAADAQVMAEERAIQAIVQSGVSGGLGGEDITASYQEMQTSLELARDQITQLSRQVMELKIQLDDERSRIASTLGDTEEGLSVSQRILALTEEQQHLREDREFLAQRLKEAEAMLAGATSADRKAVVEKLIQGLQSEKNELLTERESLQTQLDEMRAKDKVLLPQEVQLLVERMSHERTQLESERNQLNQKLQGIQSQLESLGVEGGMSGLTQLINELSEQNARLQGSHETLKRERDTLLNERTQLEDRIQREKERETRIQTLQTELMQLAGDREAVTKQRDKLRTERDELLAKLDAVKQHRARLLAQAAGYEMELAESHQEQVKLRTRIQTQADERSGLVDERNRLLAEKQALETERDQLFARVDGDRERLQQLGEDGVGSLTHMIEDLSEERSRLERELNRANNTIADLGNQAEALKVKLDSESQIGGAKYEPDNPDLVMGMVQELRTPMTSISGYIDLLLGESAGILGEMQRKFLQRVSANVTRLASMLDDLVHVTALDTGQFVLTPEPIDVLALIEDAITNASNQFREKGLTVHLDLDDHLPMLRADRDAVNQIIGQLLTNAYLVSPSDSEIFITARQQSVSVSEDGGKERQVDSLFVAVEDRGGGIAAEDEPRVFARKYKAENPLIQGLGDTGVGLSIAKALVETQGGRLWLETRDGMGSIFKFTMPLDVKLETEG